ncbi:MAG: hypothetical protein KY459_12915 [Acidobacteria bacterium]|nr:hypothetical protein [Acidobacteriota bacterium]
MITSVCDPVRSRLAIFRALARLGIGCGSDPVADVVMLTDRPRHNPLEAWTLGIAFYLVLDVLLTELITRAFGLGMVSAVILFVAALPFMLFAVIASIALGTLLVRIFAPGADTDLRRRPDLQSRIQQVLMLAVCAFLVAFGGPVARWVAVVYIGAVILNAMVRVMESAFTKGRGRSESSS